MPEYMGCIEPGSPIKPPFQRHVRGKPGKPGIVVTWETAEVVNPRLHIENNGRIDSIKNPASSCYRR